MKKTILLIALLVSIAFPAFAADLCLPLQMSKQKTTIPVNGNAVAGVVAFDVWVQLPAGVHDAGGCWTDLPDFAINCNEREGGIMAASLYSAVPLPEDYNSGPIVYFHLQGSGAGPLSFVWAQAYDNFMPIETFGHNGWLTLY